MTLNQNARHGHVIVIGGSLAGLLSARVLSDHFDQVTIVERDAWPQNADGRRGVPQGRHAHGLLNHGWQIFSRLFPDLEPALLDAGAIWADMGEDVRWHHFGFWKTRFPSGIAGPLMSRPFLEWQVARRVAVLPNVRILDECDVHRLATNDERTLLTGATIQRRHGRDSERLISDLVVDASGRGSHLPRWLESLGYPKPEESIIPVNVGYATRIFRRPSNLPGWKALMVVPRPPAKRGGVIFPLEGNRWLVTLIGWLGDHPPADEEGYLDFARSLVVPDLHRAIEGLEPLTPIMLHKFPSNVRRHYEGLKRCPERLIVLGDAVCSFNPVYGQGMTVSAVEAMALDACLKKQRHAEGNGLSGFSQRFQQKISKVVDVAWQLATGEDLRYPEAEGRRPAGIGFLHWYVGKVHEATAHDRRIAKRFYQVMHMLAPPVVLFRPDVMLRLLAAPFKSAAA